MQRIDVCAPNSDMKTDIIRGPLVIADIREGQGFGRGENQKLPPGLFLGCRVAFGTAAMSLEAGEGRTDRDAAIDTRAHEALVAENASLRAQLASAGDGARVPARRRRAAV